MERSYARRIATSAGLFQIVKDQLAATLARRLTNGQASFVVVV